MQNGQISESISTAAEKKHQWYQCRESVEIILLVEEECYNSIVY
jgi:hypothetical protein